MTHQRLVRVRLQPCNETLQVVRGHGFLYDEQTTTTVRNEGDWLEILLHVVLEREDCSVENKSIPHADGNRVTVRRRAGNPADTNGAVRASDVFDNDRLTE